MWKDILVPVASALIGAISALAGGVLTNRAASKQRKSEWLRDQKCKIFVGLVGIFEDIKLDIVVAENTSKENLPFNVNALKEHLETISDYCEDNSGMMFIFLPKGAYGEIIKLQSEIYSIVSNPELQATSEELVESSLWKAILHAKKISNMLKKDILEN